MPNRLFPCGVRYWGESNRVNWSRWIGSPTEKASRFFRLLAGQHCGSQLHLVPLPLPQLGQQRSHLRLQVQHRGCPGRCLHMRRMARYNHRHLDACRARLRLDLAGASRQRDQSHQQPLHSPNYLLISASATVAGSLCCRRWAAAKYCPACCWAAAAAWMALTCPALIHGVRTGHLQAVGVVVGYLEAQICRLERCPADMTAGLPGTGWLRTDCV